MNACDGCKSIDLLTIEDPTDGKFRCLECARFAALLTDDDKKFLRERLRMSF